MRRRLGQDEIIEWMARRAQRCSLRRRDVARADAVALDVPVAVLRGDVLRQHLEPAFRSRIRRHRLAPHFTEHRADIDDLAMSLAQHAGQHSLRDDERSCQVDIDDLTEILRRHLEHRDALDDARIVHEDVDGAKLLLDIRDHRTDSLFIRDIAYVAMRLNAIFLVVRQRLVHMRLTAAVERDFRTRIGISLRNCIANAIGRARHQCHLAHQRELFRDIKHHTTPIHLIHMFGHHSTGSADDDLTHLHCLQRILMALRRHTCTARSIDGYRHLWERRLEDHRIRDHADIRAEPDKLNRIRLQPRNDFRQLQRAKRRLLHDSRRLFHKRLQRRRNLPALLRLDAVRHRQVLPLLRLKIVRTVRILREHQHRIPLPLKLRHQTRQHRLCLPRPQRSINKIILHVDHDKYLVHKHRSSLEILEEFFLYYRTK